MISTFDGKRKDAVRARRGLIHWCGTHLSDKVTSHEQINGLLFRVAGVNREVLQVQVSELVLKERNLIPLVKRGLSMRSVEQIEAIFVVDLEIGGIDLIIGLILSISQTFKEMREDSWYKSALFP